MHTRLIRLQKNGKKACGALSSLLPLELTVLLSGRFLDCAQVDSRLRVKTRAPASRRASAKPKKTRVVRPPLAQQRTVRAQSATDQGKRMWKSTDAGPPVGHAARTQSARCGHALWDGRRPCRTRNARQPCSQGSDSQRGHSGEGVRQATALWQQTTAPWLRLDSQRKNNCGENCTPSAKTTAKRVIDKGRRPGGPADHRISRECGSSRLFQAVPQGMWQRRRSQVTSTADAQRRIAGKGSAATPAVGATATKEMRWPRRLPRHATAKVARRRFFLLP